MSALDKLRRLREWVDDPNYDLLRKSTLLEQIDRLLAEPETPEPGAFIWQCACGSRNVMSSAVCTKCGNGRPNSATPREPASAPANGIEIVGLPAGTIKHERTERGTVRLLFTPAPPLTGPNYLDQEEWGHERGAVSDSSWDRCVFRHADGRGVYVESADVIRGDDVPSVVRLRLTGDMGPGTVFEYEIKPDERAAVPTDAEVEAAMWRYRDAAISVGAAGDGHGSMAEYGDALRALIARRVAAAEKERDEARAETQQELADLHAELDEVRDERNEARAELARLRAGGCARDQTTTQWCAEAVELQQENERLKSELEKLR